MSFYTLYSFTDRAKQKFIDKKNLQTSHRIHAEIRKKLFEK